MIRIGYACINTELPSSGRTFRLRRYDEALMLETAEANVRALLAVLRWNAEHDVRLFRVTSDLVPFGSHPANDGSWRDALAGLLAEAGELAKREGMRLSMHPGQYTVLNSPSEETRAAAEADLAYHCDVLDAMGLGPECKVVLHCGGSYGDKDAALARLEGRYAALPGRVRARLAFENDDRSFNAEDVLALCRRTGAPAVFDTLHDAVLPSGWDLGVRGALEAFASTWPAGQRQKAHYSDQHPSRPRGAHSEALDLEAFGAFLEEVAGLELDVMLEVKDKQASVLAAKERFGL